MSDRLYDKETFSHMVWPPQIPTLIPLRIFGRGDGEDFTPRSDPSSIQDVCNFSDQTDNLLLKLRYTS